VLGVGEDVAETIDCLAELNGVSGLRGEGVGEAEDCEGFVVLCGVVD
jgi:hypothetical protein